MSQLDLFTPPSAIDKAFWKFHNQNPQVLRQLVRMTRQAKLLGCRRVGMKALFEVIRWRHMQRTRTTDFKLNNNYTSRYARLIVEQNPDLAGMFATRRIHS